MKKSTSIRTFFKRLFDRKEYNPIDFDDGINSEWGDANPEKPKETFSNNSAIPDIHKDILRVTDKLNALDKSLPNLKSKNDKNNDN